MCTVSLVQTRGRVIVTSNRDEHKDRQKAERPAWHSYKGVDLQFPRDPKGGGSWIVLRHDGYWGVILNGAFVNHTDQGPYRMSRGIILLDLLSAVEPLEAWKAIDLDRIEPFTVILGTQSRFVMRWTGSEKKEEELSKSDPYIWASSTLYTTDHQRNRENWFEELLSEIHNPAPEDVLRFHSNPRGGKENGLVIDRTSGIRTVSVTQIVLEQGQQTMSYYDEIVSQSAFTS